MLAQVFLWNPARPSSVAEQTERCLFKQSASPSSVPLWHIVIRAARFVYMWWAGELALPPYLSPIISSVLCDAMTDITSLAGATFSVSDWTSSPPEARARISDVCCQQGRRGRPGSGSGYRPTLLTSPASSPYPATVKGWDVKPCVAHTDLLTKYNLLIEPVRLFQLFLPDISVISNI